MITSLIELVKKLKKLDNEAEAYLDKLPSEFNIVFDNTYTSSRGRMLDITMIELFGGMYEDVAWFLYEWKPGNKKPCTWLADGTAYIFETEDDYYKYLSEI